MDKHNFVPFGSPYKQDQCARCGYPYHHTIHHYVAPEDEVKDLGRIEREAMFLEIAHVLRKRSSCVRGKVGCLIVRGNRIVASGYNGAPPGAPHCSELGCSIPENDHTAGCQRAIHAEANAIAWAARAGASTEGCTLYCTHGPCLKCAQLLMSAGICKVIYEIEYRMPEGVELLKAHGLKVVRIHAD